jgi:hypothetical protein
MARFRDLGFSPATQYPTLRRVLLTAAPDRFRAPSSRVPALSRAASSRGAAAALAVFSRFPVASPATLSCFPATFRPSPRPSATLPRASPMPSPTFSAAFATAPVALRCASLTAMRCHLLEWAPGIVSPLIDTLSKARPGRNPGPMPLATESGLDSEIPPAGAATLTMR